MIARSPSRRLGLAAAWLTATLLATGHPRAAGINTDVALPVRKGGFVLRTQIRYLGASDDPTPLDREVRVWVTPAVLVYGASSRTTLFGIVPYISQSVESTQGGIRVTDRTEGVGDLTFLVRQTIYARDAVQRTSRLGLLVGLEPPTGSEAFSSHSIDFLLGGVYTIQIGRHEFDADLIAKINSEGRGVDAGDEYRADAAYQLRLAPREWPERGAPSQIFGVIEANWSSVERSVSGGVELDDTGGTLLFLSPGIQIVTQRIIYESSIQIPVVRNLNGSQVEPDLAALVGVRIQF